MLSQPFRLNWPYRNLQTLMLPGAMSWTRNWGSRQPFPRGGLFCRSRPLQLAWARGLSAEAEAGLIPAFIGYEVADWIRNQPGAA